MTAITEKHCYAGILKNVAQVYNKQITHRTDGILWCKSPSAQ